MKYMPVSCCYEVYLAGFSWGYTENIRNEVSLLDFRLLSETDWNMQKTLISSDTGGEDK